MKADSSKKKVLFLITKSTWGGAQRYVYDMATSLPKSEYEVVVGMGGMGPLFEKLEAQGIRTVAIEHLDRDIHILDEIRVFFSLIDLFREERPDVIHINSSKIGGLGALAGRLLGVPRIIFTAHGWAFNEERSRFAKLIIRVLHYITIALSHTTIAVSYAMKAQIRPRFLGRKIVVIRNGIKAENVLSRTEAREVFEVLIGTNIANDTVVVGTIAELHKSKGLRYAIEAMAHIENVVYIVCGEGKERNALEHLIKERGLSHRVFLSGHVDAAGRIVSAFDVFLLPSITEGLGYVVLEAGAAGVPVVATEVGGIPEIIEHQISGLLVPPKDSRAIEHSITFLRENVGEAKRFAEVLRRTIEKRFSLDEMVEKTKRVYRA